METVLLPGELITTVRIPIAPTLRSAYLRFTPGSAADYPTVGAAAATRRDPDGTLSSVRLALAAVGPTVLAVPEAAELAGRRAPSAAAVAEVADAAARRALPAGSRLGSARYVRAMAAVWARRVLTDCLSQ
jgi:CO/xanthine dehydrogenase FAD-binding subunit